MFHGDRMCWTDDNGIFCGNGTEPGAKFWFSGASKFIFCLQYFQDQLNRNGADNRCTPGIVGRIGNQLKANGFGLLKVMFSGMRRKTGSSVAIHENFRTNQCNDKPSELFYVGRVLRFVQLVSRLRMLSAPEPASDAAGGFHVVVCRKYQTNRLQMPGSLLQSLVTKNTEVNF
jgi:hypothetical protein